MRLVLSILLAGCGLQDIGGGAGFTAWGLFDEVYQCDVSDGVRPTSEWCWNGAIEELESESGSSCAPTPRHLGACIYGCEPHRGCNALDGCYCAVGDL